MKRPSPLVRLIVRRAANIAVERAGRLALVHPWEAIQKNLRSEYLREAREWVDSLLIAARSAYQGEGTLSDERVAEWALSLVERPTQKISLVSSDPD